MEKTTQEKIDYIYEHIKKEEKRIFWRRITKMLIYLFFIIYIMYFYLYGFAKLKNMLIESIKPKINSTNIIDGIKENSGDLLEKIKNINLKKKEKNNVNLETY